jgi:hypothetical protein
MTGSSSMRHECSPRRTSLIAGLAGLLIPIITYAAQPEPSFLLRRGAVIDPARNAAYVSKPNGSIDAVDLASGRTSWTSNDAALPVASDDALLIAQSEEKPHATERLQIVVLNAADGRRVSGASIALPAGVLGLVADEKGRSLRVTAEREGANYLVSWFYEHHVIRGIPPRGGEETVYRFAGSARIQPQTGRVLTSDGGPVGEVPGRWKKFGTPPAPPWRSGNVSATTEGGRGGRLTLKRTETASGRPLPDQALSHRAIVALPSADQRHVLATERAGMGGPEDPEYSWSVFRTDTAEKVTELRRDISAAPFFVGQDSIIVVSPAHGYGVGDVRVDEPLEIQAVRLSSGDSKWQVEIRDLTYRGELPPSVKGGR